MCYTNKLHYLKFSWGHVSVSWSWISETRLDLFWQLRTTAQSAIRFTLFLTSEILTCKETDATVLIGFQELAGLNFTLWVQFHEQEMGLQWPNESWNTPWSNRENFCNLTCWFNFLLLMSDGFKKIPIENTFLTFYWRFRGWNDELIIVQPTVLLFFKAVSACTSPLLLSLVQFLSPTQVNLKGSNKPYESCFHKCFWS